MLTKNEKKVMRMLFASLGEPYSINQIARECNLAPNGAFKILKKFEKEGIITAKGIANIKSYSLNFENEKTKNILKLALIPELEGRVKYRAEDLNPLKDVVKVCIIFGSYITSKKEPNDLDLLFIFKKESYSKYQELLEQAKRVIPLKLHDVIQTEEDFASNLRKNKISFGILKNGVVLWGHDELINIIQNEYRK